ncbi:hypothetical protein SAMN05216174_11440 [Actinokineospora iranica]|uniref:Uncharacterized protein n=1 Tax=Actinokineospora iranica TaxID=1271860 RepID=A0A1G6W8Y0_9PSEU|nr:hypothetical protein SAMN05216174_11440 [Actinokineospora iranica]
MTSVSPSRSHGRAIPQASLAGERRAPADRPLNRPGNGPAAPSAGTVGAGQAGSSYSSSKKCSFSGVMVMVAVPRIPFSSPVAEPGTTK